MLTMNGKDKMMKEGEGMSSVKMGDRMGMVEQRMQMMEMMMGQMVEHDVEEKKEQRHKHKMP